MWRRVDGDAVALGRPRAGHTAAATTLAGAGADMAIILFGGGDNCGAFYDDLVVLDPAAIMRALL